MIEHRSLPSAVALEEVLRRGREALDAGRVDGALRTFDAALRIKPTYAPAWRAKGRALRAAGDPGAALACYAEALRHEPEDDASWLGLALTLHALGRRTDELRAYEELLRRNPRNVAGWMNKGAVLHESGRYEDALACCDRILSARPEVAPAWNNRGAALLRLGRPEDALVAFDEALALDPGFGDAAANRRAVLARLGREAAPPVALPIPPPTPLLRSLQPRVLANLALPAMEAWRQDPPEAADDLVALGTALLDEGSADAAAAAFRKAERLGGGSVAALGRLRALSVAGSPFMAEEADRILAAHGESPPAVLAVARVREAAGDLAGAWAALDGLVKEHPGLSWASAWKGILQLRLNRPAEARRSLEMATRDDPSDAEAWATLAAGLHREGRSGEALAACDRALAADPACAAAHNNRGVVLASLGRRKEAESAFRQAARHADDGTVALNRASLAEASGRLRAALAHYDAFLATEPTDANARAVRRRVLGRLGARGRKSLGRLLERLASVPGVGPATARRITNAGFDSAAKIRRARVGDLRVAAKLSGAQARAVKRAFRT